MLGFGGQSCPSSLSKKTCNVMIPSHHKLLGFFHYYPLLLFAQTSSRPSKLDAASSYWECQKQTYSAFPFPNWQPPLSPSCSSALLLSFSIYLIRSMFFSCFSCELQIPDILATSHTSNIDAHADNPAVHWFPFQLCLCKGFHRD